MHWLKSLNIRIPERAEPRKIIRHVVRPAGQRQKGSPPKANSARPVLISIGDFMLFG